MTMPLMAPHPLRWPWRTAISWIAFDLLDEMYFYPSSRKFPEQSGLNWNQALARLHRAAEELATAVVNGTLRTLWVTPSGWTEEARAQAVADSDALSCVLKAHLMVSAVPGPILDLEVLRAEVLSLWPQSEDQESPVVVASTVDRRPQGKEGLAWDWLDNNYPRPEPTERGFKTHLDERMSKALSLESTDTAKTYRNRWIKARRGNTEW